MAIKLIVELQAKPGQRAVLKSLLESVAAALGLGEPNFLGSTRYEVLDNPDILVEIADWASATDNLGMARLWIAFIVMNLLVLPLSAAPPLPVPTMPQLIESVTEHILVIGLPLGILVRRKR